MDPVYLNICDECCTKCGTNTLNREVRITSPTQGVDLQGNYILNAIEVGVNYVKVIIQNGIYVYIRTVFTTYPLQLSIPPCDCCTRHVITIYATIHGV